MKRENFKIQSTAGHNEIKHKWNSANRCVEALIGEVAKAEQTTYSLVESEGFSIKEGFGHVKGKRVWVSTEGKRVEFVIEKQK